MGSSWRLVCFFFQKQLSEQKDLPFWILEKLYLYLSPQNCPAYGGFLGGFPVYNEFNELSVTPIPGELIQFD